MGAVSRAAALLARGAGERSGVQPGRDPPQRRTATADRGAGQCIRLRPAPPPLRPELPRPAVARPEPPRLPEPERPLFVAPLLVAPRLVAPVFAALARRVPVAFAARVVAFAPFERGVAFFAVREVPDFAALRVVPVLRVRLEAAVFPRVDEAALPRPPAAVLVRLVEAAFVRLPAAAFRVPVAALRLRVPAAVLLRLLFAAVALAGDLRAEALRVPLEADAARPRPPVLFRPPFAAAAVRPAAPRDDVPLALRVPDAVLRAPDAGLARVLFAVPELRDEVLREAAAPVRRVAVRRRRGCSSCGCSPLSWFSADSGICSVSSLMR